MLASVPVAGQDQINYISQPDELTVFLNNVVFVRDQLRIPTDSETLIVLPPQVVADTITLQDVSGNLPLYRLSYATGQPVLTVNSMAENASSAAIRDLRLEYITLSGMSWTPIYTLRMNSESLENVELSFFAAIQNDAFTLSDAVIHLAADQVDVIGQPLPPAFVDTNQGFSDMRATATAPSPIQNTPPTWTPTPALATPLPDALPGVPLPLATQSVYHLETLTAQPGETVYAELLEDEFPARQVLLWNAYSDAQARVIYKIRNTSDISFAQGIVRTYQDDLFTGSDEIEYTPPGAEGSVTVGPLRDVRVLRDTTEMIVPSENPNDENGVDLRVEVMLTLTNFIQTPLELEVTDVFPPQASNFEFSTMPEALGGNILRWLLTLPGAVDTTITYTYRLPY
jgi:hypothetical protein